MTEHTLRVLEFEKVLEELVSYALTSEGADVLRAQGFERDAASIGEILDGVCAFRRILDSGRFPTLEFPEVGCHMPLLSKQGTVLDAEHIAAIGNFLTASGQFFGFIVKNDASGILAAKCRDVPLLEQLRKAVFALVDREGNVKEKDIPELRDIRKRMKATHDDIEAVAVQYFSSEESRTYWQSTIPTVKDGRTVLSLKSNFKGRVRGIVHDVSGSGATVFIEPFEIVEKNNELVELSGRYKQALNRILREMTDRIRQHREELGRLIVNVAEFDTLYARARYGHIHRCSRADIREGVIDFRKARHPLLGKSAVPIDILVQQDTKVLIITGPNTGGKTVCLKTIGLLALMHQFGMELPVDEGSTPPVFDGIFADIGDEQSLEQSLSTFSGHMRTIASIIESSSSQSLVLLDELGAGTDPEEGSALSMAMLDEFISKGSKVIVTTHHSILKNYGYTQRGVTNASVEFDDTTLSPTYKILLGLPGESHAFDIAIRNGIPSRIVDASRKYLNEERTDVARLIHELSQKQKELLQKEAQYGTMEEELLAEQERIKHKSRDLKTKEIELREKGLRELSVFLCESRQTLEKLIKELREQELTKEKILAAKQFLQSVEEAVEQEKEKVEEDEQILVPLECRDIRPGMEVLVGKSRKRGKVIRKHKDSGWVVETDTMRITVGAKDLFPARPLKGRKPYEVSIGPLEDSGSPALELDLRGHRLEEALAALQVQLDRALMKGLAEFGIIHGKGEGILQKGIHEFLGSCTQVKSFSFAHPEQGGFGKTIVHLKDGT